MRVTIQRAPRCPGWSRSAVVVTSAYLALVAGASLLGHLLRHSFTLCPLRQLTGIPCAGCGTTRAVLAMLGGHPLRAVALNPLAIAVIGLLAADLLGRLLLGRRVRVQLSPAQRVAALAAGVALLLANWVYVFPRVG